MFLIDFSKKKENSKANSKRNLTFFVFVKCDFLYVFF